MTFSQNIEIHYSPWRMLSLLTGALGFVVLGYFLATRDMGGGPGSFRQFMGFVAMIFFGGIAIVIVWRWFFTSGPVVTLTATGITDVRVAKEEIPWAAISNLALWQQGRQKSLVMSVDPQVEAALTLTRLARWTRGPNKTLGVDGLCVAANGLKTDFQTLAEQMAERYQASRPAHDAAAPAAS